MLSKLEYKYSIVAGEGILMLGFKFIENICGNRSEAWIQIQQGGFGRIFGSLDTNTAGKLGKLVKLPWHEGLTRVLRCAA